MGAIGARQQVLDALRRHLLHPGAVTDGFYGLDVLDHSPPVHGPCPSAAGGGGSPADTVPPGLAVVFRWRADPTVYAVTLPVALDDSGGITQLQGAVGWPGYLVSSAEDLAGEAALLLMEELDTGLVRRVRRRSDAPTRARPATGAAGAPLSAPGDHMPLVHLLLGPAPDVMPEGYYIGSLYLSDGGDRGEHLQHIGLDISDARFVLDQQRLLSWRHAYVNNENGEPVIGHVAVGWEIDSDAGSGGTVRVVALQLLTGWPVPVVQALLFNALRDAAEAGASTALASSPVIRNWPKVLQEAGFNRVGEGTDWSLSLSEQRWPDLSTSTKTVSAH